MVELFIWNGADVNAKNKYKYTALMLAAIKGHKKTVEILMEYGADPDATNKQGWTAFDLAVRNGYEYHQRIACSMTLTKNKPYVAKYMEENDKNNV